MREAEERKKEYRLPTTRYSFVQGSFWMSFCIILSYASVYLLSKGFSNSQIGVLAAVAGGISAVLQPIIAGVADKSKKISLRYFIAFFSLLIIGISGALLIPDLHWLLIGVFYGLLLAILQILTPLINAIGMECVNRGIAVNFGLARGVGSVSFAVASYIAGDMIARFDTVAIPVMIILFYAALLAAALTFRFPMLVEEQKTEKQRETRSILREDKKFFFLLAGIALLFVSHNMLNGYAFQIVSYHDGGSKEMGIIFAIAAIVELPTMMLFSRINKKLPCAKLLKISGTFFAIKSLLTYLAGSIQILYVVQLTQMLGFALFVPASVYYVNQLMKEEDRVKGQAFMTMTNTLGCIGGSLIGGILLDKAGVPMMLMVSTLAAILGMTIIYMTTEKTNHS